MFSSKATYERVPRAIDLLEDAKPYLSDIEEEDYVTDRVAGVNTVDEEVDVK